ncbi:deoxycytidylate deaminase [Nitrobacteraceae bacterium UC4446_H13]
MTDSHWHLRFLDLARHVAAWSRDPSTQVGAVIVRPDRTIASVGFNGFPRGVEDYPDRYADRPTKYQFVVHAEANAILNAHRSVAGCALYSTLFTCNECAKLIVQAGIACVVAPTPATLDAYGFRIALQMYAEAGVDVVLL